MSTDLEQKLSAIDQDEDDDIELMDADKPMPLQPPHLLDLENNNNNQNQEISVSLDDDNDMNVRPEALFLKGVDDLSPRDIKLYIDHYIRPDYSFTNKEKYENLNYKFEWINDSSLNIVFENKEACFEALSKLSKIDIDKLPISQERPAQEYIAQDINGTKEDETAVESIQEDRKLFVRQSFSYDKKIKNARLYSRYYLLHGEPNKSDRPSRKNQNDYYSKYLKQKNGDGDGDVNGNGNEEEILDQENNEDAKQRETNKYRERESHRRRPYYGSARAAEPDLITNEVEDIRGISGYDRDDRDFDDDLIPSKANSKPLSSRIGEREPARRWAKTDYRSGRLSDRIKSNNNNNNNNDDDDLFPQYNRTRERNSRGFRERPSSSSSSSFRRNNTRDRSRSPPSMRGSNMEIDDDDKEQLSTRIGQKSGRSLEDALGISNRRRTHDLFD
ncbi:hypothetical protein PACTADRAFT_87363 [Pachysolen tannophilus NRRL Y-2460]|uniref:Uncharacterized protein n=1 Tax=Pachysolen tannophilus NRRL Y-2460 TaxID=669874 RepID=A0A1E4TP59_PACTA|nr:hypothetical protein PACTADRAFT_87363 [Pachysolen tannophilus NRRL Y-2460]